jgi:chromosome segregation ATPase
MDMDENKGKFTTRIRDFFTKAGGKIKAVKSEKFRPKVSDTGMLCENEENAEKKEYQQVQTRNAMVRPGSDSRNEQLEKLQDGFNRLINRLENINEHLSQQTEHQQQIMERLDKLPQFFESFEPSIKNQQQLTEQMLEELKTAGMKNQRFIEAVESIPTETAKQTDALQSIDHQLAAAADCDAQMTQGFGKFRNALEKLDQSTVSQTDSILQMSKTFAASDRYLKYIISRDKKRMFWLLVISLSICVTVILAMVGIILYLGR